MYYPSPRITRWSLSLLLSAALCLFPAVRPLAVPLSGPPAMPLSLSVPAAHAEEPSIEPGDLYRGPTIDMSLLPTGGLAQPTRQTAPCNTPVASPALTEQRRQQRYHPLIDARPVWHLTRGAGQTVAIIDTGVNPLPRLKHLSGLADFNDDRGMVDCDQHGTLVAAIIGAAPANDGFAGVAPDVRILSIRQTSAHYRTTPPPPRPVSSYRYTPGHTPFGSRRPAPIPVFREKQPGDVVSLAKAVRIAADAGATVINISQAACRPLGVDLGDGPLGAALHYAVYEKDAVVVTAAGNHGDKCRTQNALTPLNHPSTDNDIATVVSPAYFSQLVLTVAAVHQDGTPTDYSMAGPWVDLAAPGDGIISLGSQGLVDTVASADGTPASITGTSFATPFVSGVVALVRAYHPEWSAIRVMEQLRKTARPLGHGPDSQVGFGMVDPLAAMSSTQHASGNHQRELPFREQVPPSPHTAFVAVLATGGVTLTGYGAWRARKRGKGV